MRCWASSGFSISWPRSYPTWASHCLKGSAFGEGIDWIILNIFLVLAQSVSLDLPSSAGNFNGTILSYGSNPSRESFAFKSDQYLFGMVLASRALTTSIIEKCHSSLNHPSDVLSLKHDKRGMFIHAVHLS